MSYSFYRHQYGFGDMDLLYQNVYENMYGKTGAWYSDSSVNVSLIVDPVLDAYEAINKKLGFDYNGQDRDSYQSYASEYFKALGIPAKHVYIVLGTLETGLANTMIRSPILRIQGVNATHTDSVLDDIGDLISGAAKGTGTVIENLGKGIVGTSEMLANLPLILGGAAILYYFLMIAPKNKTGKG